MSTLMRMKKLTGKLLNAAGCVLIASSAVLLVFGFGEEGFGIFKISEFWIIVNSLWVLAVLCFTLESRLR